MRPSGKCAIVHGLGIGFPQDEFPVSADQLRHIDLLLQCHLQYLDLANGFESEPSMYQYSKLSRRVYMSQIYFYSGSTSTLSQLLLDQGGATLLLKVTHIAKLFKYYRMKVAELERNTSSNNILNESSKMNIIAPEVYQVQQLHDRVKEMQVERGSVEEGAGSVSVCLCTSFVRDLVFQCELLCFKDNIYQEDMKLLNSSDVCMDGYRKSFEPQPMDNGDKGLWDLEGTMTIVGILVHLVLLS